jgi:hypothetical protein
VRLNSLPPEHLPVLADPDDVRFAAYRSIDIAPRRPLPALVEAFRASDAPPPLSWEPEGRTDFNGALFLNFMGKDWLPATPDVDGRLSAEPASASRRRSLRHRLVDHSQWPRPTHGLRSTPLNLDEDSIAAARRSAHYASVADRVTFTVADASDRPRRRGRPLDHPRGAARHVASGRRAAGGRWALRYEGRYWSPTNGSRTRLQARRRYSERQPRLERDLGPAERNYATR